MRGKVTVLSPDGSGDTTPPAISGLKVVPTKLCGKRSPTCKKPGGKIVYTTSESVDITALVQLKGKIVRRIKLRGAPGKHSEKFSVRGLKPGAYKLTLKGPDAAGNNAEPVSTRFTVKK
jgi:hypothetical protein